MPPNRPVDKQAVKDIWHYNLTNHTPTPAAIGKIEAFRNASKAMADCIIDLVPDGRDQALALTHLEEMSFHGIAGIVRNDNVDINQPPEEDRPAQPSNEGK